MLCDSINIGTVKLNSRLVMPPMATEKSEGGYVSGALADYYDAMSRGGYLGLVITEHCYVSPEGKASPNQVSLSDDSCVDGMKKIADAVHGNGVPVIAQISHAGSAARTDITGLDVISASAVVNPGIVAHRRGEPQMPREMTKNDLERVRECFVRAALRAVRSGFDGVEIHCAHGYFLNQFYSPLTNRRTDEYGGAALKGRMRYPAEIIRSVRDAVGKDPLISFRLGACDYMEGGSVLSEVPEAVKTAVNAGADMISISGGLCAYNRSGCEKQGWFSELSAAAKTVPDVPVMLTGGITEKDAAEEILSSGKADLIGVGRAFLKDNSLPERWICGR